MRLAVGLIGLMTLTLPNTPAAQPTRVLLHVNNLSDEIHSLSVVETPEILEVLLNGQSVKDGEAFTTQLKYFRIQAWLLRTDGTALAQASPPGHVGVGNAGESTDIMAFTFNRAPATEIAGVVVSVNGSLYIRKI